MPGSFYKLIIFCFFIASTILISCTTNAPENGSSPEDTKSRYIILGYVGGGLDWREHDIKVEELTHINYAFARINDQGVLIPASTRDSINFAHINSLKERNPDLKILISVGGWGAEGFSDAALTEESRERFTRSCIEFMKKHQLDGVDLDWEYPGQPGAGNVFRPEDKENFTLMLEDLRNTLDAESQKDGRTGGNKYLLTIATGGDEEYLKHTDLRTAHAYLDFINIMTYDLYHGNDTVAGHHSPLYQSSKEKQNRNSSHMAVQGHVKAGVPIEKIVLGVPFYGRGWREVNDEDNGLYQPSKGRHFALGYDSLTASYINKNGFNRYWDEEAKAPYLWNNEAKTFISYADPESMAMKTDYIKSEGLRGVMFWEYSHDLAEGILLRTLYEGLNNGEGTL